jgi:hypothetical protein
MESMSKKTNKRTYVISGQEIITFKSLMIDATSKSRAIEIYDEMWEEGELIEDCHEFDIEVM